MSGRRAWWRGVQVKIQKRGRPVDLLKICFLAVAGLCMWGFLIAEACSAQGSELPHLSRYGIGAFLSTEQPSILGQGAQLQLSYAVIQLRAPTDSAAAWRLNVFVSAALDGEGSSAGVFVDRTVFRLRVGPEVAVGAGLAYPFTRRGTEGALEGLGLAIERRRYEVVLTLTVRAGR